MKNVIIERSSRNPRRIKRLINSFVLEYHLNRSWDEVGVEHLVKVVMLQHFYPGFYRILVNPRGDDPITEFVQYNEIRSAVKQGGDLDPDKWAALFQAKGLRSRQLTTDVEKSLKDLEAELPSEFPTLAADRDFVALVEGFNGPGFDTRRVRQLLRRPLTTAERSTRDYSQFDLTIFNAPRVPLSTNAEDALPQDSLDGLRILWIDDLPRTNSALAEILTSRGVHLRQVANRAEALAAFDQRLPDIVLSDLGHDNDPEAGLLDLEYFRTHHVYDGPVLFCSGQGTRTLRSHIMEFGAEGPTNDENEILRWIERAAARPATKTGQP
jgi:CheY-like chemotaxis protein